MVFCAAVSHCFQWSRGRRAALGLDAGFGLKHQAPNLKLQSAQAQASVVLLQGTKRQAKSAVGAGLGWRILGAVRRALVARAAAKTAATIHAISASSRTNRGTIPKYHLPCHKVLKCLVVSVRPDAGRRFVRKP